VSGQSQACNCYKSQSKHKQIFYYIKGSNVKARQIRKSIFASTLTLPSHCRLQLDTDHTESYTRSIRENITPDTQLVMCLLPTIRKDRYDSIKKMCCIETPVPSQCITNRACKPNLVMSIATNVAIQINVKLGGIPWGVSIPLSNLMICGIDTYHDSQVKGRSVAAVCCSLNDQSTRYFSKVMFQHNRQELQDGLVASFTGMFILWWSHSSFH